MTAFARLYACWPALVQKMPANGLQKVIKDKKIQIFEQCCSPSFALMNSGKGKNQQK